MNLSSTNNSINIFTSSFMLGNFQVWLKNVLIRSKCFHRIHWEDSSFLIRSPNSLSRIILHEYHSLVIQLMLFKFPSFLEYDHHEFVSIHRSIVIVHRSCFDVDPDLSCLLQSYFHSIFIDVTGLGMLIVYCPLFFFCLFLFFFVCFFFLFFFFSYFLVLPHRRRYSSSEK